MCHVQITKLAADLFLWKRLVEKKRILENDAMSAAKRKLFRKFSWIPGHPSHPSHPSRPTSRLYLQIIALPRSTSWLGASPATACVVVNLKSQLLHSREKLRPLDIQGLDTLK